jgi:hypothetical protein
VGATHNCAEKHVHTIAAGQPARAGPASVTLSKQVLSPPVTKLGDRNSPSKKNGAMQQGVFDVRNSEAAGFTSGEFSVTKFVKSGEIISVQEARLMRSAGQGGLPRPTRKKPSRENPGGLKVGTSAPDWRPRIATITGKSRSFCGRRRVRLSDVAALEIPLDPIAALAVERLQKRLRARWSVSEAF